MNLLFLYCVLFFRPSWTNGPGTFQYLDEKVFRALFSAHFKQRLPPVFHQYRLQFSHENSVTTKAATISFKTLFGGGSCSLSVKTITIYTVFRLNEEQILALCIFVLIWSVLEVCDCSPKTADVPAVQKLLAVTVAASCSCSQRKCVFTAICASGVNSHALTSLQ